MSDPGRITVTIDRLSVPADQAVGAAAFGRALERAVATELRRHLVAAPGAVRHRVVPSVTVDTGRDAAQGVARAVTGAVTGKTGDWS